MQTPPPLTRRRTPPCATACSSTPASTTPTSTRCRSSSARAGPTRRASRASTSTSCRTSTTRPVTRASHCLREETDVGAEPGDTHALAACRATITTLYWQALATLDPATGGVDPDERTLQPEYLPFIGKTQIPVSGFYFFAGRAAHAIQDSFTHTYRRMDGADAGHADHVDLQLGVAGARRSGRGRERPRPRDDPRRLRGRQPEQRRPPGAGRPTRRRRSWPR